MTVSDLWGKITRQDGKLKVPVQQAQVLGRIGEYTVISPYGLYADLPNDTIIRDIGGGCVIPTTIDRPSDLQSAEPCFFHPSTGTRIIARNNGDLDIFSVTGEDKANINISCKESHTSADDLFNIVTKTATITADDVNLNADVTTQAFGANGKTAQAAFPLGPPATDLPTVVTLVNTIRLALIANGIGA